MTRVINEMSRRQLLKLGVTSYGTIVVGTGFFCASDASWALETMALDANTMATLTLMARDIYPHERFGDDIYAAAVKGNDAKAADDSAFKMMIEKGVATLDADALTKGSESYLMLDDPVMRLAILESNSSSPFFQAIRGDLVVSLYNQKAVWDLLGYEGASFEKGGYLDRGFDDINWL